MFLQGERSRQEDHVFRTQEGGEGQEEAAGHGFEAAETTGDNRAATVKPSGVEMCSRFYT